MAKNIYGKHISTYKWHSKSSSALVDRCLELYELKYEIKLVIWNCGFKGWREKPNKPLLIIKCTNPQEDISLLASLCGLNNNVIKSFALIPNESV